MSEPVRVKICGLTTPEQAEAAAAGGADFIGLVFAEQSRRRVTVHQARTIISALPVPATVPAGEASGAEERDVPRRWFESAARYLDERLARRRPLVVGIFANQSATIVNAVADRAGLDLVQLSGNEAWEEALAIRRPVIKTIHISADTTAADALEQVEVGTASLCHLDTASGTIYGGTGQTFDWHVAAQIAREMPIMLAGGLTPENISQAIRDVHPWAVDVSSGVETQGAKDIAKIKRFLEQVRSVETQVG